MTNEENILQIVFDLAPEHKAKITADTDLFAAGIIDSFGMLNLLSAIEDAFGVAIADDDLDQNNFRSVTSIAALVARLKQ